jgi:Ca2+:H+ antiporter
VVEQQQHVGLLARLHAVAQRLLERERLAVLDRAEAADQKLSAHQAAATAQITVSGLTSSMVRVRILHWTRVVPLLALVAVVDLDKTKSPAIEDAVEAIGAPQSAVGVIIALLVLLPEALAAVRNARRDRVQISFNLALGSAMASIGLTIPAMAVATIWLEGPLVLGLGSTQLVLLAITVVVGALTVLPGRATIQEGGVRLVLFAAFLFLAIRP